MKKQELLYAGKKKTITARKVGPFGMFWGLMFSTKEKSNILLFDFKKNTKSGIHSFFVFFSFIAVWLDEKDNIIQIDKVRPWTTYLAPKKKYKKLIEIPISKRYKEELDFLNQPYCHTRDKTSHHPLKANYTLYI